MQIKFVSLGLVAATLLITVHARAIDRRALALGGLTDDTIDNSVEEAIYSRQIMSRRHISIARRGEEADEEEEEEEEAEHENENDTEESGESEKSQEQDTEDSEAEVVAEEDTGMERREAFNIETTFSSSPSKFDTLSPEELKKLLAESGNLNKNFFMKRALEDEANEEGVKEYADAEEDNEKDNEEVDAEYDDEEDDEGTEEQDDSEWERRNFNLPVIGKLLGGQGSSKNKASH